MNIDEDWYNIPYVFLKDTNSPKDYLQKISHDNGVNRMTLHFSSVEVSIWQKN